MRVVPQISVTTTEETSEKLGYKKVIIQVSGNVDVQLAFSYKLEQSRQTDWISQGMGTTYKYEAPKGKKIWYVFYKTISGTSIISLIATDGDVEKVG